MLSLLAAAAIAACPPLPGVEQLWARAQVRTVILGEVHGTEEGPALFGDVVCHASLQAPVVVALELRAAEQPELDDFMAGGQADALLATPSWSGRVRDGRSSRAMLRLLERLRALKAAGRVSAVVAVQPDYLPRRSQDYSEILMAAGWAQAGRDHPEARIFALVGNLHARKTRMDRPGLALTPAAMHLPPAETLSLDVEGGGQAWYCRSATDCGPGPIGSAAPTARGVRLGVREDGAYDGVFSSGTAWTASPPAP